MIKKSTNSVAEDGWVVNLDNINIKNSEYGAGYTEVDADSEIVLGTEAPDVYICDAAGEVYYAKGIKSGEDTIFAQSYIIGEGEPINWTSNTVTGTSIVLNDTFDDSAFVKINGKSEQTQTVQGNNILDVSKIYHGTPLSAGSFRASLWADQILTNSQVKKIFKPSTTYYIKATYKLETLSVLPVYSRNVGFNLHSSATGSIMIANSSTMDVLNETQTISATFTTPADLADKGLLFYSNRYTDGVTVQLDTVLVTDLIISEANVPYEPFVPNKPSPDYPSTINNVNNFNLIVEDESEERQTISFPYTLASLSNGIKDYIEIDNVNKTAKLYQNIGTREFDGTETWYKNADSGDFISFYIIKSNYGIIANASVQSCTHAAFAQWVPSAGNWWWDAPASVGMRINKIYLETYGYNSSMTDAQKITCFKQWLTAQHNAGTPVIIQYRLTTPTVTDLDYEEVVTYYPFTKISTNATVQPNMEVTYKKPAS
jgi:hypothetical protein